VTDASSPHLDDERLSSALDEHDDAVAAHLAGCTVCRARSDALAEASAFAASPVAPLDPVLLDALIATAVAEADRVSEPGMAPVVPLASRRRGRLRPPPVWLVGAAAALVLLAGIGSMLRRSSSTGDNLTTAAKGTAQAPVDASGSAAEAAADGSDVYAAGGPGYLGSDAFAGDLGDQSDPQALGAAVNTAPRRRVIGSTLGASPLAGGAGTKKPGPTTTSSTTTTTWPANRPRCEAVARSIGAGNFGPLDSAWTARWKGTDAEVLVFVLTEPAGKVTRQAMVLRRPDCALLADPRF
jgi:hypothetical protein